MKSFKKKSNAQRVGTASNRMWKERTLGDSQSTSPPQKSMGILPILMVSVVVVSTFMSAVQMHLLENYGIDMPSSDSTSPMAALKLAFAGETSNRTTTTLGAFRSNDDKCDNIDESDEELKPILKILCKGGYEISKKRPASRSRGDDDKKCETIDEPDEDVQLVLKRLCKDGYEISKSRPASRSKVVDSDDKCENIDEPDEDLKPILKILCQGGYDVSKTSKEIDRSQLPKFSKILDFYGPPKVLGLETCATFRENVPAGKRIMAPAGMFNTGTNLLAHMMEGNCEFDGGVASMRWQVPWGKHMPFELRHNNTVRHVSSSMVPHTLPVVMVRDPYTWMQSMCKQPYAAQFPHDKKSCPNIAPYESDMEMYPRFRKMKYIPIHVKYSKERGIRYKYESMPGLYNDWYGEYIKIDDQTNQMKAPKDFPFLVIRLEDLVFHASTVIPQMCECVGGKASEKLRMTSKIANMNSPVDKSSGLNSGLSRSIVKYGNITRRRDQYPDFQLKAAKETLDANLLKLLRYPYEEP